MLDPTWTPEKGYSHVDAIMAALAKADAVKLAEQSEDVKEDRSDK